MMWTAVYPKAKGKSYDKWPGDQKKPSHRERICFAIDDVLAKNPESFDALLGFSIRPGMKSNKVRFPPSVGQNRETTFGWTP